MFVALVFVVAVIYLLSLSIYSRRVPVLGLKHGRLRPCGPKPNCVCSEEVENGRQPQAIEPINYGDSGLKDQQAWELFKKALAQLCAQYIEAQEDYLRCFFITKVWRFVDDFEARLDTEKKCIHIRSASRVGYSDGGLNQRRVQKIKERFEQLTVSSE